MNTNIFFLSTKIGGFRDEFIKFGKRMKEENMIPYGNPVISPEGVFIQLFFENKKELNDKYLDILIDELKYLPGSGSAFLKAQDRFYENGEIQHEKKKSKSNKKSSKNGGKSKPSQRLSRKSK
jgi:hypothetical protein